jgi:hypothetical protein
MVDLDALIQRARGATVRREVAEAYVRELERWTSRRKTRPWRAWALATAAAAAAATLVLVLRADGPELTPVRIGDRVAIVVEPGTSYRIVHASPDDTAIEVDHGEVTARLWPGVGAHHLALQGGGMVAMATGTVYSLAVERGSGEVHVDEGTVEVRVGAAVHSVPAGASWPPDRVRAPGHRRAPSLLALAPPAPAKPTAASPSTSPAAAAAPTSAASPEPEASTATASPAPESTAAAPRGPGSPGTAATSGSGSLTATAASGSGSPATASSPGSPTSRSPGTGAPAAAALSGSRTIAGASPQGSGSSTGAPSPRPRSRTVVAAPPAGSTADAAPPRETVDATPLPRATLDDRGPAASLAIKERWRFARKLRAEGKHRAAIAECLAIADTGDPTWSPIALVEAIRLYSGPLSDPGHAIDIADRVIRDWPADGLVPEARKLRCRALGRLGRGGECAPPPTPTPTPTPTPAP